MNTLINQETFLSAMLGLIPLTAGILLYFIFAITLPKPVAMNDSKIEITKHTDSVDTKNLVMKD